MYTVVLQVPYHGAFYWSYHHEEDCLVSHHHVILLFLFPHLLLLASLSTLSWYRCVCGGLCRGDCCVLNAPLHLNVSCLCHVFYTTQNKHTIAHHSLPGLIVTYFHLGGGLLERRLCLFSSGENSLCLRLFSSLLLGLGERLCLSLVRLSLS